MNSLIENARVLALFDIRSDTNVIVYACKNHQHATEFNLPNDKTTPRMTPRGAPGCACTPEVIHLNFWETPSASKARDVMATLDFPHVGNVIDVIDTALAHASLWHCPAGCSLGLALTFSFTPATVLFDMPHDDDCPMPTPVDADGNTWVENNFVPVVPSHGHAPN